MGIEFQECPDTSNNGYDSIVNGAMFHSSTADLNPPHNGKLEGREYGKRDYPSIGIHANAGITFDLEKI